jgi:hypothetical protein
MEIPSIKLQLNLYMQSIAIEESRVNNAIARIRELAGLIQKELLKHHVINEPETVVVSN